MLTTMLETQKAHQEDNQHKVLQKQITEIKQDLKLEIADIKNTMKNELSQIR